MVDSALDHYRRMIATCRDHGLLPVVTFHHFTTPRWAAADGGWDDPAIVDRFARFCERAVAHLGDEIGMACTINEPNVVSLIGLPSSARSRPAYHDLGAYDRVNEHLKAAHRRGYDAIKAGPGRLPRRVLRRDGRLVGPPRAPRRCSTTSGTCTRASTSRPRAATTSSACRRTRAPGSPSEGMPDRTRGRASRSLDMGYEYWPQALEVSDPARGRGHGRRRST